MQAFRPSLAATAMMLAVLVINANAIKGPPLFKEKQIKYYTALFLVMVVGIPFSIYARHSFDRVFTEHVMVVLYFYVFYKVVNTVDRLSVTLLLSCLGSGIYSAVSLLFGTFITGRVTYGTMFDPNDLAYFILVFLPFNLIFVGRDRPLWIRIACLSSFGSGILLILLSGSRGGLVAFAAVMLVFFVKSGAAKTWMKLVTVALSVAFFAYAPVNIERYSTLLSLESDYNISSEGGRLAIWSIGIRTMAANPLTGVGVGNYGQAVGRDRISRGLTPRWQGAHNSAVQLGAETGVIGLGIFLWASLNVLRILNQAKKTARRAEMVRIADMSFLGFVGMFTASLFLSQGYSVYWAFYVALSAAVSQMLIREQPKTLRVAPNRRSASVGGSPT
jgi:O-antigen ligase